MRWEKLGKVFASHQNYSWMTTHASNPVAAHLHDDTFRVFFGCRDAQNRSNIGFVDIDLRHPFTIHNISQHPVLAPGETGTFSDSGVSLACLVHSSRNRFLYYVGWNLAVTVPWRNSIGLAIFNTQTQQYSPYSRAPIIDRHEVDPFSVSYPFVLKDDHCYRMWYGSNLSWGMEQKDMQHVIKYAESSDGINWERKGVVCIDFAYPGEYAISRPCVVKDGDTYKMWYSYRGQAYRIGYAESADGLTWRRRDHDAGIDVSPSGWDADMICYPFVFDHGGSRYMLYNGNGYGKSGFGLAILEQD